MPLALIQTFFRKYQVLLKNFAVTLTILLSSVRARFEWNFLRFYLVIPRSWNYIFRIDASLLNNERK